MEYPILYQIKYKTPMVYFKLYGKNENFSCGIKKEGKHGDRPFRRSECFSDSVSSTGIFGSSFRERPCRNKNWKYVQNERWTYSGMMMVKKYKTGWDIYNLMGTAPDAAASGGATI